MAQSKNSTRGEAGLDNRLSSGGHVDSELPDRDAKLSSANEFFSTLDPSEIVVPNHQSLGTESLVANSSIASVTKEPEIVAELDTSQEDDLENALDEALGSELQQKLPPPVLHSAKVTKKKESRPKRRVRKARPAIRIETRDDEPFQWKDLLTRKGIKQNSSFLVSLLLHTLLIVFLSLLVVRNGIGDSSMFLDLAEAPANADEGLLDGLDINPVEFSDENMDVADEQLNDLMDEMLEDDESQKDALKIADFESDDGALSSDSQFRNGRADGDGKSATFFGTKASGRRFVFVVDRSISMRYGSEGFVSRELFNRYDIAKSELLAAIGSLKPHQEFFVVMFAHDTIPMFDGASDLGEPGMMAATPENIARFEDWLEGVKMGPGTDPREGLEMAIDMKPDAVFMLSDGAFVSERNDNRPKTVDIVESHARAGSVVPINTVSLVVEQTIPVMKSIADMSEGKFRFTTIKEYITQVANLRGPMRFRALDQLVNAANGSWPERYELIRNQLLPMLAERSALERARGETLMHRATMGLFDKGMPSVLDDDKQAIVEWKNVVEEIDGYFRTGQISALGQGRESQQEVLLSMLEIENEDSLNVFEKLDIDRVSSLTMIEMLRAIARSNSKHGASPESVGWLRYLSSKLNGKKPKDRAELARIGWNTEQSQVAIDRLLQNRAERAAQMYAKYSEPDTASNIKDRLGKAIASKYPETKEATRVQEEIDGQRAGGTSFVSENDSLEDLFGQ